MSDSVTIAEGPQPIEISSLEEHIDVAIIKETIHPPVGEEGINVTFHEERMDFSSPLVLATPGWPFGPNPNKVDGLKKGVEMVVDTVTMPTYYKVARWLFLAEDEINGLVTTSEIKCMRRGNTVTYIEYAIIGDSGLMPYDLDVVVEDNKVKLVVTSHYEGGDLTVRTSKIGIFS